MAAYANCDRPWTDGRGESAERCCLFFLADDFFVHVFVTACQRGKIAGPKGEGARGCKVTTLVHVWIISRKLEAALRENVSDMGDECL